MNSVPMYKELEAILAEHALEPTTSAVWEHNLVFGRFSIKEVLREVKNDSWQRVRISMLGSSLEVKWTALRNYLITNGFDYHSRCVVTNYVYALKRGGVIK